VELAYRTDEAGKPQISRLRYVLLKIILQNLGAPYLARSLRQMWETADLCAPVEMTKLGIIANQAFLNPIFIP
jgi:hypothetical protein